MPIKATYPGVYVEEIPSGVSPITGVSTADTAFVDFFKRGPVNEATRITSFQDFERIFGGLDMRSEASYAIQQFFIHGGQIAWVVRVEFPYMSPASVTLKGNGEAVEVCKIKAASVGTWAKDNVRVAIDHNVPSKFPHNFNMVVREVTNQNGNQRVLSSEIYRNLSADSNDARFAPKLVNPVSQLVQLEDPRIDPTVISEKNSYTFTLSTSRTLVANFKEASSSDVTLSDLKVGVITVDGFAPIEFKYEVELPSGTNQDAPAAMVTATPNNPEAVVNITQAEELPGAATVVVTVPDQPPKTYTVNLKVAEATSDAALRELKVGETRVSGFDPGKFEYNVQLPNDTKPQDPAARVTAIATASNDAEVKITQAAGLPGVATVVVTALDRTTKTYTVNLTVCTVTHTVNVSANPSAGGTVDGRGTYTEGASVTVTATPNNGYSFDKWTEVVRPDPTAACGNDIINAPKDNYFSVKLTEGNDGNVLDATTGSITSESEFVNALKSGMYALDKMAPFSFNILCIPATAKFDFFSQSDKSINPNLKTVVTETTKYCKTKRAFFIMDILPVGDYSIDSLKKFNYIDQDFLRNLDELRDENAAVYFPQLQIPDSLNGGTRIVGASGTMAGIYAKTDATRGVWKAPAGTEAKLVNASIDNSVKLNDLENGVLNQIGINVIRNFPNYSNVSWGARTLKGSDLEAGEWKYIPVRRTALFIEESLYQGLKWAVFEPNDEPLWAQIRLNVGAFMHNLFRQGAFQGRTRNEAYFVKCDKETTTQNDIDQGIVNVMVGFAPLKPAEFVVIQLQQMAGQILV